jgi:hypothetical protein
LHSIKQRQTVAAEDTGNDEEGKTKYLKVSGVNCTASTGAGITTD